MQTQPKSPEPLWTVLKILQWTAAYLKSHHIENPRAAAEILLAYVLKTDRVSLYVRYDQPLGKQELQQFKSLIQRRIQREPVAYITGIRGFWSMDLQVNPDVLIPRPETECLVEAVLEDLSGNPGLKPRRILDLGTGSGTIILALASQLRQDHFFASDRSFAAVLLARKNARQHQLDGQVHFFCADWMEALKVGKARFDIILSNPPYVRTDQIAGLEPEVSKFEPFPALNGGSDGLECLRLIVRDAHRYLKPGGRLFLEIGFDQREDLQNIIQHNGNYSEIIFKQDYAGLDRVVSMKKIG